ncbi:MAG: PEGA domain-containing protein [Sandaracinaceae bacterium]
MNARFPALARASSAAVLALVALTGATAYAQDAPRAYIVAVPTSEGLDAVATRVGAASRAALRSVEGVDWRGPDQLFLGYDDSALSVLDRAREQLEAGRQAYLNLEFDQAIQQLSGAVDNFDAASAALEDPSDLGQALLFLGASHGFNGQRRDALNVFRRLHTQMPHIQPDPDTFPPDVVNLYNQARPRDAGRPEGVVVIDSNPQGAIAYVDFLARGRTPLQVRELIGGEHVVRVTRPGATPFVESLTLRSRQAGTSDAYLVDNQELEGLSEAIEQIATADVDAASDGPIAQVATMLQVDKIGVIRVSDAGSDEVHLELLLFDARTGRRLVRGEVSASTEVGVLEQTVQRSVGAAFQAALRPTQVGDGERIPAIQEGENPIHYEDQTTGPSTPITEEWWFWTIIGVVAVGLIVGGIAIGLATQGPAQGSDRGGQVVFTF